MHKYEKETEALLLKHEKSVFNQLRNSYAQALADTKAIVKELEEKIDGIIKKGTVEDVSILRSKIYQLNYQKALEKQLSASMDVLSSSNVTNVQSFLTKMYEDGYLSINYHLQKQGIPITTPINPSLMVKVVNTPVEKMTFSKRLYKNANKLKKSVKSEISRGIATGKTYSEIAKQLTLTTEASFNQAYRIARTEGGRVSSEAKLTSMRDAREKGADLVKQWDATLDGRTRESHARLDQQIREIDEEFEIDGMKALCPHGFGRADMDINCRCVMLSVPRWDIEEENERYDNIKEEIVKVKNYETWKEQYYGDGMFKYMDYVEGKYKKYNTSNFAEMLDLLSNTEYKNFTNKFKKAYGIIDDIPKEENGNKTYKSIAECYKSVSLGGIESSYATEIEERLLDLQNKYPINADIKITTSQNSRAFGWNRNAIRTTKVNGKTYVVYEHKINFSKDSMKNKEESLKRHNAEYKRRGSKLVNNANGMTTIDHEYAHAIDTYYFLMKRPDLQKIASQYSTKQPYTMNDLTTINNFNKLLYDDYGRLSDVVVERMEDSLGIASDTQFFEVVKDELGSYATTNRKEFFAEAFSNMRNLEESEKTDFIKEFETIFNEEFEKVIKNASNKW